MTEVLKKLEALIHEYEKDVETILSYTPESLSKLSPCDTTFVRNPLVEEILKNAESNSYKFDNREGKIVVEVASAIDTIDFVKTQMDFWKGRSEEYIIGYRVANGQSQYAVQQEMAEVALSLVKRRLSEISPVADIPECSHALFKSA